MAGLVQVPRQAVKFHVHVDVEDCDEEISIAPLDLRDVPVEGDLARYSLISG